MSAPFICGCGHTSECDEWKARAIIAEAQVAAIRDMWSASRWLQFSMAALHQIRDQILGALDSWERA